VHTADRKRGDLTAQGYCLSDAERRELAVRLRFSTGLCLSLVALALESPAMVFALPAVGVVAGFTARHPFDHPWNYAVRRVVGGPSLPPNPTRRRHAVKIATAWLSVVGTLLATRATTAGLVLGGLLVAACAMVTSTNLCLPSETFAWWARHTQRKHPITTEGAKP
jgi:Domain of unknown function (DUF4395)